MTGPSSHLTAGYQKLRDKASSIVCNKGYDKGYSRKTIADHTLLIDEILRNIAFYLYDGGHGQGSLATLARSHKAFTSVALEAQWQSLNSIDPLIQVLLYNLGLRESSDDEILKECLVCI